MIDSQQPITKEPTKLCPACRSEVSVKATRCPHCRQDLRSWVRRHPILTFLLFLIFFPVFLVIIIPKSDTPTKSTQNTPTKVFQPKTRDDFRASVQFNGTQFIISNLDDLDCIGAKMEINGGWFKDGYTLEGYTLASGQTYEVGAMQFTKKDGTRFNPFERKPKDIFIECQGNNELQYASYLAEFK